MKVPILRREHRLDGPWRILECGHEVREPSRDASKFATSAWCKRCQGAVAKAEAKAQVLGICTAIHFPLKGGRRECGRPAKHLKDGQPRCGFHAPKGSLGAQT